MTPDDSSDDGAEESTDDEQATESEEVEETSEETTEEQTSAQHQQASSTGGFLGTPEESNLVKEWVKFVAATIGLIGLASGLMIFLYGAIDEAIYTYSVSTGLGSSSTSVASGLDMALLTFGGIGIAAATFWGVYFGWNLDVADDLAFKTSGISGAAGTAVLFIIAGFLMSTATDADLEFAGLLINTIVAALLAGGAGAGAVWIARNQSPSSLGEDLDSPGPIGVNPSD